MATPWAERQQAQAVGRAGTVEAATACMRLARMPSAMDGTSATGDVDATTTRWDVKDGMGGWRGANV
jgi:hypothetical protein